MAKFGFCFLQHPSLTKMAFLTAAEVVAHPAYQSLDWKLSPTTSGTCPVAQTRRGGPINLYYQIHGTGPTKLVVSALPDFFLKPF